MYTSPYPPLYLPFYQAFSLPSYAKNLPESSAFSPFKTFNIPPILSSFSITAPSPPTISILASSSSSKKRKEHSIQAVLTHYNITH